MCSGLVHRASDARDGRCTNVPDRTSRVTCRARNSGVNLLANAVKFAERGDIVLAVHTEGEDANQRVMFTVSDTGAGITPEHHDQIFDPFWRVDPTLTRAREGTGLGLSVARHLARLLGGDVVLTASALGRGSTFEFSLPVGFQETGRMVESERTHGEPAEASV
jgi:signal transduction histidine kinase